MQHPLRGRQFFFQGHHGLDKNDPSLKKKCEAVVALADALEANGIFAKNVIVSKTGVHFNQQIVDAAPAEGAEDVLDGVDARIALGESGRAVVFHHVFNASLDLVIQLRGARLPIV